MKKNLTLLVMLAAFVGIVSAQTGPKFNYQAVVRHQDTLYHNQTIDVNIRVMNGTTLVYAENFYDVNTTDNGLVSLVLGGPGADGSLLDVDWANATIVALFDLGADGVQTVSMPVVAVPYAFEASIPPITTEMIADYAENRIDDDGMTQILNAIISNPNGIKNGLKQMVINYMKAHKDIARDIADNYLNHFDAHDVRLAYESLNTNEHRPQLRNKLKQIILTNRPVVKDLVLGFIQYATEPSDIQRAYQTMMDVPEATKNATWNLIISYATAPENRAALWSMGVFFINHITLDEAASTYNTLKNFNPEVNTHLRLKIDQYVDLYLAQPENAGITTVTMDKIDNGINNYLQNHPRIETPTDCTIDICNLKSLYDAVAP